MKNHSQNIVEYQLEAGQFQWEIAPGKIVEAWGFNQQFPGPQLYAKVGDLLRVVVTNNLPEPTMIHWHGLRIPASMDGTGAVQKPIQPGESFTYEFTVPDSGTFWYHSHFNETVQLERGMYGPIVIEDDSELITDNDKVFMIDDMKLDASANFTKPSWYLPRIIERHDGREGNTLLINGKETPEFEIHAGQIERWRFINSSSARYFLFQLDGREFKIIATDGGLIEKPVTVTEALITPGERLEILVGPFHENDNFNITSMGYNRVTFLKPKKEIFASVKVIEEKSSNTRVPEILRSIQPIATPSDTINRQVKLSVGPSLKNGMNFLVNNDVHVNDKPVKVGELQVWEVINASLMDHPFHLHGYFFQIMEINGRAPEYISWKDTVNLPPRSKVKIAWMPDNRPGIWMYHCHILEHHEAGMMANFEVVNEDYDAETYQMTATTHCH